MWGGGGGEGSRKINTKKPDWLANQRSCVFIIDELFLKLALPWPS